MRNTAAQRRIWANYVAVAREVAGLSQSELARRLGVNRVTVWRWEDERQVPEDIQVVQRFAALVAVPVADALAAAGLAPGAEPPPPPQHEPDPELDMIRNSRLRPEIKKRLIQQVLDRRAREETDRLAELETLLRALES